MIVFAESAIQKLQKYESSVSGMRNQISYFRKGFEGCRTTGHGEAAAHLKTQHTHEKLAVLQGTVLFSKLDPEELTSQWCPQAVSLPLAF